MHNRIAAVTGFLATATLLSGSAFAFAPDFEGDLPTVIITDKLATPDSALAPFDQNTGNAGAASTQYLFRYSDAFALQDYVVDLQGNDFNQVKVLFNEYNDENDTTPNSVGVLTINGTGSFGDIPVVADGDWDSAPLVTARYADGGLDFRNIDFSPIAGPNSAIGALTGDDILSGPQQRIVEMYLKGDTNDTPDIAQFLVITTTEGTDALTTPVISDPWSQIVAPTTNFDGWITQLLPDLQGVDLATGNFDNDAAGDTAQPLSIVPTPVAGSIPASSPLITVSSSATTSQGDALSLAGGLIGANATANKLYRLRANLYSNVAAANQTTRLRLTAFPDGTSTTGEGTVGFLGAAGKTNVSGTPTATDSVVYGYLYSKGTGALALFFDVVNVNDASTAAAYNLGSYTVSETDFADLGSATTVYNIGGTVPTPAAGEIIPVLGSPVAFATSGQTDGVLAVGGLNTNPGLGSSANRQPVTIGVTAEAATVTFGQVANRDIDPGTAVVNAAPPSFVAVGTDSIKDYTNPASPTFVGFGDYTANSVFGNFLAETGKVYSVEVWASRQGTSTVFPDLRIGAILGANQVAYGLYNLDSTQPTGLSSTAPRAYSAVFEPNVGTGDIPVGLQIYLISIGNKSYAAANATVVIHRIQVREFNNGR